MRMKKDRAKRNCLKAAGYPFVEYTDKEIKTNPTPVIASIRDALKHPAKYTIVDPAERAELEESK